MIKNPNMRVAMRTIEMLIEDRYRRTVLAKAELMEHVEYALREASEDLGMAFWYQGGDAQESSRREKETIQ
jgi:hypothetical protein